MVRKISLRLNLENERDRRAYEIIQNAEVSFSKYIMDCVIANEDTDGFNDKQRNIIRKMIAEANINSSISASKAKQTGISESALSFLDEL